MDKRKLGRIEVTEIGIGCMGFSHGYGAAPPEDYSVDAIRSSYEYGCDFFDTAEGYGTEQFYPGHNEEVVGKALKPYRDDCVIATKLHISESELADDSLYSVIRRHLERSMRNLGTDHVELYYLHRLNENIPVQDVAYEMGKLIDQGLIDGWGLSQVDVDTLSKAHEVTPVSALQRLYSMLERDCESEIIPYCMGHGIGFVPFSPIASGFLSGKITVDTKFEGDDVRRWVPQLSKENITANQPVLDVISDIAAKKGATNAQISLAWMLHKYPNVVPIPGSKNREMMLENLGAWKVELTEGEFAHLEKELDSITVHGHRGAVESHQKTFGNHWRK